ncbi:MAG: hypothetical protein ACRYGK_15175 [Janthinobacterium lividum]
MPLPSLRVPNAHLAASASLTPASDPETALAGRQQSAAPLPSNFSSASTVVDPTPLRNAGRHTAQRLRTTLEAGGDSGPGAGTMAAHRRAASRPAQAEGRLPVAYFATDAMRPAALTRENLRIHNFPDLHADKQRIIRARTKLAQVADLPPQEAQHAYANLTHELITHRTQVLTRLSMAVTAMEQLVAQSGTISPATIGVARDLAEVNSRIGRLIDETQAAMRQNLPRVALQVAQEINSTVANMKSLIKQTCENLKEPANAPYFPSLLENLRVSVSIWPQEHRATLRNACIDGLLAALPGWYEDVKHTQKNKPASQIAMLLVRLINESPAGSFSEKTQDLLNAAAAAQKKHARILGGLKRSIPMEKNILQAFEGKFAA